MRIDGAIDLDQLLGDLEPYRGKGIQVLVRDSLAAPEPGKGATGRVYVISSLQILGNDHTLVLIGFGDTVGLIYDQTELTQDGRQENRSELRLRTEYIVNDDPEEVAENLLLNLASSTSH